MTIPRQLAPPVGPAHGGVEFLEGSVLGIEGLAIFQMKKSWFERIYISIKFINPDLKVWEI